MMCGCPSRAHTACHILSATQIVVIILKCQLPKYYQHNLWITKSCVLCYLGEGEDTWAELCQCLKGGRSKGKICWDLETWLMVGLSVRGLDKNQARVTIQLSSLVFWYFPWKGWWVFRGVSVWTIKPFAWTRVSWNSSHVVQTVKGFVLFCFGGVA